MQDNPYRSPKGLQQKQPDLRSPRARVGDCSLVGLVLGGTIGAATGAVMAICLLGWIAITTTRIQAASAGDLATVEDLIADVVVRIALGSVLAAVAGALLGALLGPLAVSSRLRNPRWLPAIAASVSAVVAALCTGLLWCFSPWPSADGVDSPWPAMLVIAITAGALGGAVLGRRLLIACSPSIAENSKSRWNSSN